ncbi:response regulator [Agaribacter flavus]|uniref:Response regulator n=1 Tax=Agaribacter flavus TaxID=1902781 RepID=A0ABV7FVQ9_9ALTE
MQQRVLLVEDDEDLGQLMVQFIQADGFSVDWHRRGELVLSSLASLRPDIILMDVHTASAF